MQAHWDGHGHPASSLLIAVLNGLISSPLSLFFSLTFSTASTPWTSLVIFCLQRITVGLRKRGGKTLTSGNGVTSPPPPLLLVFPHTSIPCQLMGKLSFLKSAQTMEANFFHLTGPLPALPQGRPPHKSLCLLFKFSKHEGKNEQCICRQYFWTHQLR